MRIFSVLLTFLPYFLWGQTCLPSGITLVSQTQIDNFSTTYPGCTEILGDLVIDDAVAGLITNLNGLNQIQKIGGNFEIRSNSAITNLSGLNSLTDINGYLTIIFNSSLTNLDALNSLDSINGDLGIFNNSMLNNINGLSNLSDINGFLSIQNNGLLTNLSGLANIAIIEGDLILQNNNSLNSLSGLNNIEFIGGKLNIGNLDALTNLDEFLNLDSIGLELTISGNDQLSDLTGLNGLTKIGGRLSFSDNPLLSHLNGLNNLTSINGSISLVNNLSLADISALANIDPLTINSSTSSDITIMGNSLLPDCAIQSICNALAISGTTANINSNSAGCNSIIEVETACIALPLDWTCPLVGSIENSIVVLKWSVSNQVNNAKFYIERGSNSSQFIVIGSMNGELIESAEINYSFEDKSPKEGLNYYRIRQMDTNQAISFSNTISIRNEHANSKFNIFPNPTSGILSIEASHNSMLRVFSVQGVPMKKMKIRKGNNSIDFSSLEAGLYTFVFENGSNQRVVITN